MTAFPETQSYWTYFALLAGMASPRVCLALLAVSASSSMYNELVVHFIACPHTPRTLERPVSRNRALWQVSHYSTNVPIGQLRRISLFGTNCCRLLPSLPCLSYNKGASGDVVQTYCWQDIPCRLQGNTAPCSLRCAVWALRSLGARNAILSTPSSGQRPLRPLRNVKERLRMPSLLFRASSSSRLSLASLA